MIQLHLAAGAWKRSGATQARGYAHLGERFIPAEEIAAALEAREDEDAWRDTVRELNGCFAAVTQRGSRVLAAVDRVRSIPLFYAVSGLELFLGDDAYWVLERSGSREVNEIGETEFCLTGYVTGDETLYSEVHQVRAGHLLRFDHARPPPEQLRYYEFRHGNFLPADLGPLVDQLAEVHGRVFRRLLAGLGGRPIVVPLSGGYDSRLIGVSLRDLGAKDVLCYTYGVPGNWESRISQELAAYLGFRWEFVPYSAERWRAWGATEAFNAYFRAAGNLTSVPHLQDWPTVLELKRAGRLPPGGIFVPGHTGDFLTGGHVPKWYVRRKRIGRRALLDSIQAAHYSLWDWPSKNPAFLRTAFDRRVESIIGPVDESMPEEAADLYERWELQERQAKFICNSLRVYEAFGHSWRLPLFDAELMDFWARIPLELRTDRRLYYEFVRSRQSLPITQANRDHSTFTSFLIAGIQRAGMRATAKRIQSRMRHLRWKTVYSGSPVAWFGLVDREFFRRTYTGKELLHSYMALRYRDLALGPSDMSGDRRAMATDHVKNSAVA